jgi:hypothetical protein
MKDFCGIAMLVAYYKVGVMSDVNKLVAIMRRGKKMQRLTRGAIELVSVTR